jgi:hypothetical protein
VNLYDKAFKGGQMATGIEVLFISIAGLLVLWAIVIYGSSFFGPK